MIDFLDAHQGTATVLLTLALIAVTAFYAWQNRRMVVELARTRELSVLPKLTLEFLRLGPTAVDIVIKNVGPGPALGIDVCLAFQPKEGQVEREERRWRRNLLAPGEQSDFLPPGPLSENLNALPERYESIRLTGSMTDAAGKTHEVDEEFADLAEWRELLGQARERYVELPERELAKAFHKKFGAPVVRCARIWVSVAGEFESAVSTNCRPGAIRIPSRPRRDENRACRRREPTQRKRRSLRATPHHRRARACLTPPITASHRGMKVARSPTACSDSLLGAQSRRNPRPRSARRSRERSYGVDPTGPQ